MSKLAILIPHYKETEEEIKPLLDSINNQINVTKDEFEVIIGNDGDEVILSTEFLKQYPYRIQYHTFSHTRLAGCRKNLFEVSDADYVMFCDSDDRFINELAFNMIIQECERSKPDGLVYSFLEEHKLPNGYITYIVHNGDAVFVHGKVWRSAYLRENRIEWDASLHEHQDSAFNVLARMLSKNVKIINMPIYLWHDNPKSICRKDGKYHAPKTWPHMIDSYESIVGNLLKRGLGSEAAYYAKYCLYATYFEMAREVWAEDCMEDCRYATYKRLNEFFQAHDLLIDHCTDEQTEKLIKTTKEITEKKGKLKEMPPFEEWLKSIITIFKGG